LPWGFRSERGRHFRTDQLLCDTRRRRRLLGMTWRTRLGSGAGTHSSGVFRWYGPARNGDPGRFVQTAATVGLGALRCLPAGRPLHTLIWAGLEA
jgi:hypothetical protein